MILNVTALGCFILQELVGCVSETFSTIQQKHSNPIQTNYAETAKV